METKFQTSFIPKKSVTPAGVPGIGASASANRHKKSTSLFMTIAAIAFISSLAAGAGAFAWKNVLISSQKTYQEQLGLRQQQFNIDLIEQLKQVNIKIDMARRLMSSHIAVSQIFDIIARITIQSVRFQSMELSAASVDGGDLQISMRGYGTSFPSVAFQSDVLAQLEQFGLRKVLKNPILSDPVLDQNGTVSFGFTASVEPQYVSYERTVTSSASSEGSANGAQ